MGYCEPADINIATNMMMPEGDAVTPFITEACEEMDGKLGWLYSVPIDLESVRYHERVMLKTICRKLATGRMINTYALPDEGGSTNALGRSLVKEALDELHALSNGDVPLSAPRADLEGPGEVNADADTGGIGAEGGRMPSVSNVDSESLVSVFERSVYGGEGYYALPGDSWS